MRATIRPKAIILTKARRAVLSMMSKGRNVASVLPLRCFLFFTTQINVQLMHLKCTIVKYWQEGSVATWILPVCNTSCSSLPVGSKPRSYLNCALCTYLLEEGKSIIMSSCLSNFNALVSISMSDRGGRVGGVGFYNGLGGIHNGGYCFGLLALRKTRPLRTFDFGKRAIKVCKCDGKVTFTIPFQDI